MVEKKALIKFAARCRDQDRQYEINNNCELDNGVYHKFVYSSHEGAGGAPAGDGGKNDVNKKDLNGGLDESPDPLAGDMRKAIDDDDMSSKMKQSTRNNIKHPNNQGQNGEESFIQSFEHPSENYEDMERRIQSAKI